MYSTFFGRFRSWADIAAAPIEELEEHFKPIGLWQHRARSMKALSTFAAEQGGQFPDTVDGLAHVPAVGQYTSVPCAAFQLDQRAKSGDPYLKRQATWGMSVTMPFVMLMFKTKT